MCAQIVDTRLKDHALLGLMPWGARDNRFDPSFSAFEERARHFAVAEPLQSHFLLSEREEAAFLNDSMTPANRVLSFSSNAYREALETLAIGAYLAEANSGTDCTVFYNEGSAWIPLLYKRALEGRSSPQAPYNDPLRCEFTFRFESDVWPQIMWAVRNGCVRLEPTRGVLPCNHWLRDSFLPSRDRILLSAAFTERLREYDSEQHELLRTAIYTPTIESFTDYFVDTSNKPREPQPVVMPYRLEPGNLLLSTTSDSAVMGFVGRGEFDRSWGSIHGDGQRMLLLRALLNVDHVMLLNNSQIFYHIDLMHGHVNQDTMLTWRPGSGDLRNRPQDNEVLVENNRILRRSGKNLIEVDFPPHLLAMRYTDDTTYEVTPCSLNVVTSVHNGSSYVRMPSVRRLAESCYAPDIIKWEERIFGELEAEGLRIIPVPLFSTPDHSAGIRCRSIPCPENLRI